MVVVSVLGSIALCCYNKRDGDVRAWGHRFVGLGNSCGLVHLGIMGEVSPFVRHLDALSVEAVRTYHSAALDRSKEDLQ